MRTDRVSLGSVSGFGGVTPFEVDDCNSGCNVNCACDTSKEPSGVATPNAVNCDGTEVCADGKKPQKSGFMARLKALVKGKKHDCSLDAVVSDCKESCGDKCSSDTDCSGGCTSEKMFAHQALLSRVLSYENNAVVARIQKELTIDQNNAHVLFKDTLQFLWMANVTPGLVPPPLIDEAWHCFILFTKDYDEFCKAYFGRFMHHRPRRPEDKSDGGKLRKKTIADINQYVGVNVSNNWKFSANGDCDDQSCSPSYDCNGGGD